MHQVAPTSYRCFAMSFNKLPQFVSPVTASLTLGTGCTKSILGGPGPICLPTSSYSGKAKLRDYVCRKTIAPRPNMPWFWDLVAVSSQNSLCLPNLVTQPFRLHTGIGGHGGRVVTLSPPTSESGVRSPHGLKWESW